jgi:hypothetical protein
MEAPKYWGEFVPDLPPVSSHEQFVDFISDFLDFNYIWEIGSHEGWLS